MAALDVLFETPEGKEELRTFRTRPLGVEFIRRAPLVVSQARSEALELGVEKGWTITAIGGKDVEGLPFDKAFQIFKEAVQPLKSGAEVRPELPESLASMSAKMGPVDPEETLAFLRRFGYQAKSPSTWVKGAERPDLLLGAILGHCEKGSKSMHTWYVIQGSLAWRSQTSPVHRWHVERRLVHLRSLLHDRVREELGSIAYDDCFAGCHFAHRAGPKGTTARLEAWLGALAACINDGKLSPRLTAAALRFLEAPELGALGEASPVAAAAAAADAGLPAKALVEAEPVKAEEQESGGESPAVQSAVQVAAKSAAKVPPQPAGDDWDVPTSEEEAEVDADAAVEEVAGMKMAL